VTDEAALQRWGIPSLNATGEDAGGKD
jgi:hypothetical protein